MNGNLAYQEERWDEMIDGRIVLMSPRPSVNHNTIAFNVNRLFYHYLKGKPCRPFGDGTDLYLSDGNRFVPDGMIVCDRSKIKPNGVHGVPDLVVEVLSPGTVRYDRGKKRAAYEKAGVREYWLINPTDRMVEQYVLQDGVFALRDVYSILPDYLLSNLTEEERATLVTEFRCTLFDDLTISLYDVFEDVEAPF